MENENVGECALKKEKGKCVGPVCNRGYDSNENLLDSEMNPLPEICRNIDELPECDMNLMNERLSTRGIECCHYEGDYFSNIPFPTVNNMRNFVLPLPMDGSERTRRRIPNPENCKACTEDDRKLREWF
jgi:hypothetical protein